MTDADDFIDRIIYDLVFYRRSSAGETEGLRALKHNDDLCPAYEQKLDMIVSMFERYQKVVYDTQGLRDRGIDVQVQYQLAVAPGEDRHLLAFQIKSTADLAEDMWLMKLKAQCLEALGREHLVRLYVVIASPIRTKEERAKVRAATAELADFELITVVHPEYAHGFMQLEERTIGAFIKRYFSTGDIVFRKATDSIAQFSPEQAAMVIVALWLDSKRAYQLTLDELLYSDDLRRIYCSLPDVELEYYDASRVTWPLRTARGEERAIDDRILEDIEKLDGLVFDTEAHSHAVAVRRESFDALWALMLDGVVRYDYVDDELVDYTLATVKADDLARAAEWRKPPGRDCRS